MIPNKPEARDKPLPQPPAQGSRRVARDAERQTQIVFANDVPAFPRRHTDRRVAGNIPAIVFEAADQAVAGGPQKPVFLEIADVIFEQDQSRLPAREIESAQDLELVAFDIDRQQIEPRRRASFDQNVVERSHRYFNDPLGFHTRCHPVAIERRQGAGEVKTHAPAGILRRGAGHREHLGRARAPQIVGKVGLRLDQDAGPTELL